MVLSMVFVAVCWTLQFAVHEMSDSLRLESGRSDSVNGAQAHTKTFGNHPVPLYPDRFWACSRASDSLDTVYKLKTTACHIYATPPPNTVAVLLAETSRVRSCG